jgi:hypothetical protein
VTDFAELVAKEAARVRELRVSQGLLAAGGQPIYVEDYVVEVWRLQSAGRDADARELLARVWAWGMDTAASEPALRVALRLFRRLGFVTDDVEAWERLPERLEVARAESAQGSDGFCWTLDPEIAEMHAARHGLRISRGLVPKSDVLAYITGRGEEEIVVLRERVIEDDTSD